MKFITLTFGCQMNYADAARIRSMLQYIGRMHVSKEEDADIIIFVTCSVREKAEDKITGRLMTIPKHQKIWMTGCMPQHFIKTARLLDSKKTPSLFKIGNFLGKAKKGATIVGRDSDSVATSKAKNVIPVNYAFNPLYHTLKTTYDNIELFFRIDDTGHLPSIVRALGYDIGEEKSQSYDEYNEIIMQPTTMHTQATTVSSFVPISTGCSQFCSYCIVPYARGLENHLDPEMILTQIRHHLDQGVQEITLLGQIVNKHPQFVSILEQIFAMESDLKWLRYTSPYPTFYSDALIKLHAEEPRLCPHIHIPLQSGSDTILKAMHRGYTSEQFRSMIVKIRSLDRYINLTTDVIVGFCDETEEDFLKTLDLVDYAQFTMIYIGKYSVRPGTYAANHLKDTITKQEKEERRRRLNECFMANAARQFQQFIGQTHEVLITHVSKQGAKGYNQYMHNIIIPTCHDKTLVGQFVDVVITGTQGLHLDGELLSKSIPKKRLVVGIKSI
ncbi:MAG: MiaB/RimO family radical SAM methylthiotransferase [Candidatus Absconditabacterales bacterium]|nr:MiaB/RimO family radical SAM methylthiotransferase [Candidatus Absconditabacterales bacterium]